MKNVVAPRNRCRTTAVLCLLFGSVLSTAVGQQVPPNEAKTGGRGQVSGRDSVDVRAPENRQATKLLDRITQQIQRGEWATAIPQLQSVLDQKPNGLVRVGPGRFKPVRTAANELLGKMPGQWRDRYVQQFEAVAAKSLDEAVSAGDYRAVADVAGRYQHTKAGALAIRAIALRHADRGEFSLARHWFEKLGGDELPDFQRLQRAIVAKMEGQRVDDVPESVDLGGRTVRTEEVLKDTEPSLTPSDSLHDWPMLMGSADRRAVVTDRLPMLIESWSQPLLESQTAEKNTSRVIRNVLDSQSGVIPAALPIVVDGKVACRTANGVSVFEASTGALLWRTQREASTVSTLESVPVRSRYSRVRSTRDERVQDFIFRDGVHGLLSSDGTRLFVIEDQMMPRQSYTVSRIPNGVTSKLAQETATNTLAAYNIQTGAIEWRIGGVDSPEVFKPTLAGHYFHGVPVAYRDELFVVVERDNAIRLQVLDAVTGEAKWSQLLAFVDTPIERDFFRRLLTAQVTVSHGMVLCPTTADWLIAIDPLTQGILWAQRHKPYGSEPSGRGGRRARSVPPLSSQWAASAPVVAGSTVVFTPPESTRIEALNVTTGKRQWSAPKLTRSYLAGVTDKYAVLVGRSQISGIELKNGRTAWNLKLPDRAFPAGRGVMSGRFLHQPLSSGEVISVTVESGAISHETVSPGGDQLFGNLVMYADGMLLQTPTDIRGFDLRPIENEPPRSLAEAIKAAQVALADGDASKAIAILDQFDTANASQSEAERRANVLKAALLARVSDGILMSLQDLERLEKLGADKSVLSRMRLVRKTADKDYVGAFRDLVAMYESSDPDTFINEGPLGVRQDLWIHGKLFDTWKELDEEARSSVEELVAGLAEEEQAHERFVRVFGFHPTATDLLREQFEAHVGAKQFIEAEAILRTSRRQELKATPELAFRCAAALASSGHRVDANSMLLEYGLKDRIADLPAPAELEEDKRDRWKQMKWRVEHVTSSLSTGRFPEVPAYRNDVQFHRDYLCLRTASGLNGRMTFLALKDERVLWSLPMPSSSGSRSVIPNGRSLFVVHGNRLSCVSPLERRVLWDHLLPGNAIRAQRVFHKLTPLDELRQPTQFSGTWRPVAIANEDYVCIRNQRRIEILDAVTGRLRWSRDDINPSAQVVGTTEGVFVEGVSQESQRAFRANDGSPIPVTIKDFDAVIGAIGHGLCLAERTGMLFAKQSIRLFDPIRKSDVWRMRLDRGARFAITGERELVATSGNDLQVINLVSGDFKVIAGAAASDSEFQFVATTPTEIFVASTDDEPAMSITELELDGQLSVFDGVSGDNKWTRNIEQGVLSVTFFRSQPALVLTENRRKVSDRLVFDVALLDRNSGQVLASTTAGGRASSSLVTSFDPATNHIDVGLTSSRKVRFIATPAEAKSSGESP